MFARLFTILLLLGSTSLKGDALLDCARLGEFGLRGDARDLIIAGDLVLAAEGAGLAIYGVEGSELRALQNFRTERPATSVARDGNLIVVGTPVSIELFRIQSDRSVQRVASAPAEGRVVAIENGVVAAAGSRVRVFRIQDSTLSLVREQDVVGTVSSLLLSEGRLFIGEKGKGIRVTDALTGARPTSISAPDGSLVIRGSTLFSAGGGAGIFVTELSSPLSPVLAGVIDAADYDLRDLALIGNTLYALDSGNRLLTFDVTNPRAGRLLEVTALEGTTLAADGDLLAAGGRYVPGTFERTHARNAVRLFRRGVSGGISLVATQLSDPGVITGVATDGEYAYTVDSPFFRVVDIRVPETPREIARIAFGDLSHSVRLYGSLAIVYGIGNVHMFDVAVPANPRLLGTYRSLGIPPGGAAIAGRYLVEANRPTGFHVVDISDPARPVQIAGQKNDMNGIWYGVVGSEGVAYGFSGSGIKVIDLSDPKGLLLTQRIVPVGLISDAEVAEAHQDRQPLLLVLDDKGLQIIDISDKLFPRHMATADVPTGGDLTIDDSIVYITVPDGRLVRVDLTRPASPVVTHLQSGLSSPKQIAAARGRVVVADTYSLVVLDDLSNAEVPIVAAPELTIAATTASTTRVIWMNVLSGSYEVQHSVDSTFANATTILTAAPSAEIPNGRVVRVRGIRGCQVGPWSAVLGPLKAPPSPAPFSRRRGAR